MSDSRATRSAEALWSHDQASRWFGFQVESVEDGRAVVTLTVEAHHCNGHRMLHGGVTFALADTAFAFACNSRNVPNVAQTNTITYLKPGRLGDHLIATAVETRSAGKTGIYDVTVALADGTVIAEFRGQCRALPGTLYDEGETPS